mgnify:CR=1 FL=1
MAINLNGIFRCITITAPVEFTKRAFLNGRIDLSEAEAVMDIISSKNKFALENSMEQLKGSVSNMIKKKITLIQRNRYIHDINN